MELTAGIYRLRPFAPSDRERLAEAANDKRIWRNLTNLFPHPYSLQDADEWIELCAQHGEPTRNFVIALDGDLVGSIGLNLLEGEKAHMANIGYWIAAEYWGRGIATQALRAFTSYAFDAFPVSRLQTTVFGWNPASARVLEKCGYQLEGRRRGAIRKGDETTDELCYGLLESEAGANGII